MTIGAGAFFTIAVDTQMLVGLILYGVLSPLTWAAFSNMGAAMKDPTLRFYAVEHVVMMVIAIALVHIGRTRVQKATSDAAKHRTAAIFFGLALVLILAGIPWPFREVGGRCCSDTDSVFGLQSSVSGLRSASTASTGLLAFGVGL